MIQVTKAHLPDRKKLERYIDGIYERAWLTNNGELLQEFTHRLEEHLGIQNLLLVANGTLALQVAYRVLGLVPSGANARPTAVTTPFTFVATASSLMWEGIRPVFADIDPGTWCLDPKNLDEAATSGASALVPVHVFGNACDATTLDALAHARGLKVIYDGAHAFGVRLKGRSVLAYGDATTLSFHATKLFHSIEGGAIIFREKGDLERAKKLINFGITGPETIDGLGINAKMNEFQAAMGLAMLDEIDEILEARERVWNQYRQVLEGHFQLQTRNPDASNNFAYFPVVFESEATVLGVRSALKEAGVMTRRYFYPSLDNVPLYGEGQRAQPRSRAVAERILCLPLYAGLRESDVSRICEVVLRSAGCAQQRSPSSFARPRTHA